jgi:hypothetical protein
MDQVEKLIEADSEYAKYITEDSTGFKLTE